MKKVFIVGAALFGAVFAVFFATNGMDYSLSDFFEWLKSIPLGLGSGAVGASQAIIGTGDPNEIATNLVMGFEGFRAKAYVDETGNLTIGYGHKIVDGDGFDANSSISQSDAQALLSQDLQTFQACVEAAITQEMSPGQEAAMISLCYNIGCDAFSSSTLVSLFNSGDVTGASEQFLSWDKGHVSGVLTVIAGLAARRSSEQNIFDQSSTAESSDDSSSEDDS